MVRTSEARGTPVLVSEAGGLNTPTCYGRVGRLAFQVRKASAFTHSLARNHGLVDGNKRLALAGLIAFLGVNGYRLVWSNDEGYEFIMVLARGGLDDIQAMAGILSKATELR